MPNTAAPKVIVPHQPLSILLMCLGIRFSQEGATPCDCVYECMYASWCLAQHQTDALFLLLTPYTQLLLSIKVASARRSLTHNLPSDLRLCSSATKAHAMRPAAASLITSSNSIHVSFHVPSISRHGKWSSSRAIISLAVLKYFQQR